MKDEGSEFQRKVRRLRELMARERLEGLLLSRPENLSWLACGADRRQFLPVVGQRGAVLVTGDVIIAAAPAALLRRLEAEASGRVGEIELLACRGETDPSERLLSARRASAAVIGSDRAVTSARDVSALLARLQWRPEPEDVERYRSAGQEAGLIFGEIAQKLRPGKPEHSAAARCSGHFLSDGFELRRVSVASDERLRRDAGAPPTAAIMERAVRIGVEVQRNGVTIHLARLISFGEPDPDLLEAYTGAAATHAELIGASRASDDLAAVLSLAAERGATGGPLPGACREGESASAATIEEWQPFAWSGSLQGVGPTDTVLAGPQRSELLTVAPAWPRLDAGCAGVLVL